jgi:ParB family chromosome partitioning protein
LIPEAPSASRSAPGVSPVEGLKQIDLDRIRPNPEQPRRSFEDESLEDLARSLKRDGVLQPVVVREAGAGAFELIAGERRWRAAQMAGLLRIPAVVRDVEDERLLELALIENLQREELNPIEAATAFRTLLEELGLTQEQVAQRVGKQRTTISNFLRLLNLPRPVQERVEEGQVSMGHAKALASLAPDLQTRLADRIARENLSVRQTERLVQRLQSDLSPEAEEPPPKPRDPNVEAAEQALQKALGTRVSIVERARGGGRIELHFYGSEELERVYQIILRAAREPGSEAAAVSAD